MPDTLQLVPKSRIQPEVLLCDRNVTYLITLNLKPQKKTVLMADFFRTRNKQLVFDLL